jgi:hypothetical protein
VTPGSPPVCESLTPEAAAEIGVSPVHSGPGISGLLVMTGASIAGLVIFGALSLGLGGALRPLRRTRRTALA